jgi:uncharacterized membrane protein YhaH (DUF805 family)
MFHYYLKALNKTFTLGRSRRKEYWYFGLVNFLIAFALALIGILTDSAKVFDRLLDIYNLLMFIPNITISIRRLHDIGKSGWFMLFPCVVILGLIALVSLFKLKGLSIVFMVFLATVVVIYFCLLFVRNGDDGPNQYGPDPKHED